MGYESYYNVACLYNQKHICDAKECPTPLTNCCLNHHYIRFFFHNMDISDNCFMLFGLWDITS